MLDKFIIFRPILDKISDGQFFTTLFFWFLRLTAVLIIFIILGISWKMWSFIPSQAPFKVFISLAFLQIFLLVIGYFVANILLLRGEDIRNLPPIKDYSITPIFVIFIKMQGEILATVYASLGISMGLVLFIGGQEIISLLSILSLPGMGSDLGGGSGFFVIITGILIGFLVLFFSYFIAEQIGAMVDIARNTKRSK